MTEQVKKNDLPLLLVKRAGRWLWLSIEELAGVLHESYLRFCRRRHLLYAAAISYYGLISLVPLLAIAISVCGWMVRSEEAGAAVSRALATLFPIKAETLLTAVREISATSSWAFVLYLFGLLWAGAYLFESIERVVNAVCGGAEERNYFARKFFGMLAAMVTGILLLSSIFLSAAWATLGRMVQLPTGELAYFHWVVNRVGILLPLVTSSIMFTLVYKILPTRRSPWGAALAGGIFAGLCWEFCKWAFGLFVVLSGRNYGTLYGSLANIVLIMIWIYLCAIILIYGAHVCCIVRERSQHLYK